VATDEQSAQVFSRMGAYLMVIGLSASNEPIPDFQARLLLDKKAQIQMCLLSQNFERREARNTKMEIPAHQNKSTLNLGFSTPSSIRRCSIALRHSSRQPATFPQSCVWHAAGFQRPFRTNQIKSHSLPFERSINPIQDSHDQRTWLIRNVRINANHRDVAALLL
jgi:hypothetical protein